MTKPNLARRMWRCIDCLGLLCVGERAPSPPRERLVGSVFALVSRMWIGVEDTYEGVSSAVALRGEFHRVRIDWSASACGFQLVDIAVLPLRPLRFPGVALGGTSGGGIFLRFLSNKIGGRHLPVLRGHARPVTVGVVSEKRAAPVEGRHRVGEASPPALNPK
jgi:hypothetical protein